MSRPDPEPPAGWRGRVARCLVGAGLFLAGCSEPPAPTPEPTAGWLDLMVSRCVSQMAADTCRAAADRGALPAAGAASVPPVFVAGIGAVDGQAYAEIRRHGEAMCSVALADCRRDPQSTRCVVARHLWSEGEGPAATSARRTGG